MLTYATDPAVAAYLASNGGPYDDVSFVAGNTLVSVLEELASGQRDFFLETVPKAMVNVFAQAGDDYAYSMTVEPLDVNEEVPAGADRADYVTVVFTKDPSMRTADRRPWRTRVRSAASRRLTHRDGTPIGGARRR